MLLLLLACSGPDKDSSPSAGDYDALGGGLLNPFPSAALVTADGLTLPADMPYVTTPLPTDRLRWRTGFSPVQTAVLKVDAADAIDPASIAGQTGLGTGGSVRIVDLDTGLEIPCLAELDAHEAAITSGERSLLVRPMQAMTPGHRVAVVLTSAVQELGGGSLALDTWDPAQHAELLDTLAGYGQTDVAVAWDFPIGDPTLAQQQMFAARTTPESWSFDDVEEAPVDGMAWRMKGTFTTQNYLVDGTHLEVDDAGMPVLQGTATAPLYVYIPDAVLGAPAGSVPVLIFGHGILGEPDNYLNDPDDEDAVIAVANRLGAIVVATVWRGLSEEDQLHAIEAAGDFGRIHEVTEMLQQGVLNTLSLLDLVHTGGLLDDPALLGLGDRDTVYYYGISLGSIEGAVVMANQDTIGTAVLHVGGSAWSTMLERSSDWPAFEVLVEQQIPDPYHRQLLYAASQLYWDPIDPANYATGLQGRAILWQEVIGDDQVPNISTELLMRSVGVPLGTPAITNPYGVSTVDLPTVAPAFTQFDPQLDEPDPINVPAAHTGAHTIPRSWEGCIAQTVGVYLNSNTVDHYCDGPCTAESTGE